jgi:hypothetical protein
VAFLSDLLPIYFLKDAMLAHGCDSAGWIFFKSFKKEQFKLFWKLFVNLWSIVANSFNEGVVVSRVKWAFSVQHLVENTPNPIDITFEIDGSSSLESFRRQIQRSSKK